MVDPAPVDLTAICGGPILEYGANYQCGVGAVSTAGPAQGSITYSLDQNVPVTALLDRGRAQFAIPLPAVGTHTVVIAFAQQGNYAAASARTERFIVVPAPVRVGLTASSRLAKVGASLAFEAAVSSNSGAGSPKATGVVAFKDGPTLLATVPVDANGRAGFSTTGLSAGSHTIIATYSDGTNYATGSDSVTVLVVR
jgi:hypothetical protein